MAVTLLHWSNILSISDTTFSQQGDAITAPLPDGGYVVVWGSRGRNPDLEWYQQHDLLGRIFNAEGSQRGGEFEINALNGHSDIYARVATLDDGRFCVVWQNGGLGSADYDLRYRVFDPDGTPLFDELSLGGALKMDVTALAGGQFMLTWQRYNGNSGLELVGRIINPDGTVSGGEFFPNRVADGIQEWPSVTQLADGRVLFIWQSGGESVPRDESGAGIFGRIVNLDGTASGDEFQINSTEQGEQWDPRVCALKGGGFAVTYNTTSYETDGQIEVLVQVFDSNGDPLPSDVRVNTATYIAQYAAELAALPDGGFVVVWTSDAQGVMARTFDEMGNPTSVETVVFDRADPMFGDGNAPMLDPFVSVLDDGRILVTAGQNLLDADVWQRILDPRGATLIGDGSADVIFGNQLANIMRGNAGADTLSGLTGADSLLGGEGNDLLQGGAGNDLLDGGTGSDRFEGGKGSDTAQLAGATITVNLGRSGAQATGQGNDTFISIESVQTGAGNDRLTGNGAANGLWGGGGADTLSGAAGNDSISGGAGRDTIIGGAGVDILSGGTGGDTFVLRGARDLESALRQETITDFESGLDRIDLTGTEWSFIGTRAFSGEAGETRLWVGDTRSVLQVDTDGDRTADARLVLIGVDDLLARDLIL